MLEGMADEMKLEEELKNLIEKKWDWQAKRTSGDEYMAKFQS